MANSTTNIKQFFAAGISFLLGMLICLQINLPVFSAPDSDTQIASVNTEKTAINTANKKDNTHIVATTMQTVFKADNSTIWNALTDFNNYPTIFRGLATAEITKREGDLVYTESHLKPGLFIKTTLQHTINDLSAGPTILNWHMVDGNFKYLKGKWELQERTPSTCTVKYTLYVDFGPIVPAPLVNIIVHHLQQDIVADLKHYTEAECGIKNESHKVSSSTKY